MAARASSPPTVDGDLSDAAYSSSPIRSLTAPDAAGGNRVAVRFVWTDDHLYFAVEVEDSSVETTKKDYPPVQDGVELFLDTLLDRSDSMHRDDYQFAISADSDIMTKDGGGKISLTPKIQTEMSRDGYRVEGRIGWNSLEITPEKGLRAGLQVGFLIGINDLDDGDRQTWAWPATSPWKQPDEWGYLRLGAETCRKSPSPHPQKPSTSGCSWAPEWVQIDQPVCRDDADAVVSARANLRSKIEGASPGDVVYIDKSAKWDVTGMNYVDVARDVTLSGGRGCDCAKGALLYVTRRNHRYVFRSNNDNVRFTGIRLRGAVHDRTTLFDHGGNPYQHNGSGAKFTGDRVEVDNNKLFGWTARNLKVTGQEVRVHHNILTRTLMEGLGYGVSVTGGANVKIDHNYFEYNRHAIGANGETSYEAAYNVVGPNMTPHHFFDMHGGGKAMRFHHNTFRSTAHSAIIVRGTPSDGVWIEKNWFYHSDKPDCDGDPRKAWSIGGGCTNVHISNDNHFGTDAPPNCNIGGPRPGCP